MAAKKTGISHDLIIHPGETIADILEERGITQAELAVRTGVSPAYVSNVIAGKKGISANFAMGLEYALGVPKSFWLNLQANYEAELLAANEQNSVTEEEQQARDELRDVVKYLRRRGMMPKRESKIESVLSLRKALQISNIENLKEIAPAGAFRMSANSSVNPLVLGAWIRLCQISGDNISVSGKFDLSSTVHLVEEIKNVMCRNSKNFVTELKQVMGGYGIEFSVVQNFRGAPVHGYIFKKNEEIYQIVLTIRGAFADIFWFSLFHEIGHIVNGDLGKLQKFVDDGGDDEKERAADLFAGNALLESNSYKKFVCAGNFSIEAIQEYAASQNVMPYIVIGRLQKEKFLQYNVYSGHKLRYKWDK